jgi:amino acid permease
MEEKLYPNNSAPEGTTESSADKRVTINEKDSEQGTFTDTDTERTTLSSSLPCWKRYFGPIRAGSLRGATIAMASITFGGGCLAFPSAVAQCGPIVSLLIFIFVAVISYYTLSLLLQDGTKTRVMDYNELIVKTMGTKMLLFSDINNIILCFGTIMSYQLTVYNFALQLGEEFLGFDSTSKFNRFILQLVCMVCIQIPLNLLKNIATLQYASIIGTITLIYSIGVVIVEMPFYLNNYLQTNSFPPLFVAPNWGYLDTFATFIYGFSSHNGIFQIFIELSRPSSKRNYKVLRRSFLIELLLYTSIAYCGFFSTLYGTPGVFLDRPDLPGFHDYFIKIAKITLFVCLHCSMAINNNIMRMSVVPMFFNGAKEVSFGKNFIMVTITYILANIAVFFIKSVVQIIGMVGGFCSIVICFINPIMIHILLSELPHTHPKNLFRYILLGFIVILGCSAGTKSFIDIIN